MYAFYRKYCKENMKTVIFFMDTFSHAIVFHFKENDYQS